jgi:hypothetical protein
MKSCHIKKITFNMEIERLEQITGTKGYLHVQEHRHYGRETEWTWTLGYSFMVVVLVGQYYVCFGTKLPEA